ncbi:hypothetical protein TSAR_010803, partial [Trichomalopsis sarcophagae]
PLYDGCDLTRAESELLILSLSLRHSFTNDALDDVLKTIDCHLPHNEYKSSYRFLKSFSKPEHKECYYCPDCPANLNFETNINRAECEFCHNIYLKKQLYDEGTFFYHLPLESQLTELMQSPLYLNIRRECEESDVINGEIYKDMSKRGIISKNDITIQ